jgi:TatD DNase family protein
MKIFDSHCHLDDTAFSKDLDAVIQRAKEAQVHAMMIVGLGPSSGRRAIAIADRHRAFWASVGIHPHDARTCSDASLRTLQRLAGDPKVKAWGEIGLDFNRMHSPREDQERCFVRQIEIAQALNCPMIFHERESGGRFLEILTDRWTSKDRGVVHCFSGNDEELAAYLDLGLFIGITGILTIQKRGRHLRRQAIGIPRDRLVVETDAPYLIPTPERNKFRRNEPGFVRTVLLKLAEIRQENPEALAETVWNNTVALFGLKGDL